MTIGKWSAVYDILVNVCGAIESERSAFLQLNGEFFEWRFQGKLGFGGKLWNNMGDLYVTCYPEDKTKKRRKVITEANKQFKETNGRFFQNDPLPNR